MNYSLLWKLIRKEWHFGRFFIAIATAAGLAMLMTRVLLAGTDNPIPQIVSLVLFYGVLNGLMWMPLTTVTSERTEQTLAFLMSLPITVKEYTAAKVASSLLMFLLPWLLLGLGAIALTLANDAVPNAYVPLVAILLTQLLMWFCVMLSVALLSESGGLTSAAGLVGNIVFWFSFAFIGVVPGMGLVQDPVAVWNSRVFWMLPAQLAAVPVILGFTFFLQARKTDFV